MQNSKTHTQTYKLFINILKLIDKSILQNKLNHNNLHKKYRKIMMNCLNRIDKS